MPVVNRALQVIAVKLSQLIAQRLGVGYWGNPEQAKKVQLMRVVRHMSCIGEAVCLEGEWGVAGLLAAIPAAGEALGAAG